MKLSVVQTRPVKGDIHKNIQRHTDMLDLAIDQGAQLVVFPELSLTGYEPELANQLAMNLHDHQLDTFQKISDEHNMIIGAGLPLRNDKGICIAMALFEPGHTRKAYSKKYLHTDEEPFFVPGNDSVGLSSNRIALAICYELSVPQHSVDAHKRGDEIYIASAAKSVSAMNKTIQTLSETAKKYSMTVLFSNCVGISGGFECGGKSSIWNSRGILLAQLDHQHEGILSIDMNTGQITTKTIANTN